MKHIKITWTLLCKLGQPQKAQWEMYEWKIAAKNHLDQLGQFFSFISIQEENHVFDFFNAKVEEVKASTMGG